MSKRPFTVDKPPASVQPQQQPTAPQPEPLVTDGEWGVFPATPQPDQTTPPPEPPTPPVRRKRKGHSAELDALIILTVVLLWGWMSIAMLPPRSLLDTVVTALMVMAVVTGVFLGGMVVLKR